VNERKLLKSTEDDLASTGMVAIPRDCARVIWHEVQVDEQEFAVLKDEPRYLDSLRHEAAHVLARKVFETAEQTEMKGDEKWPPRRIFRYRVALVLPDDKPTVFARQIDDAERRGFEKAIDLVRGAAAQYAKLSDYGPSQALALYGVVDQMRRNMIKKTRSTS